MYRSILATTALIFSLGTAHAATTTLFADDFEAETPRTNGSLSKWAITEGSIDVLGGTTFGNLCLNGTRCIDLDGSTRQGGTIQTGPFTFANGATYTLSFDYGSNGNNNSMNFGITGGLFSDSIGPINQFTGSLLTYTKSFTAIGSGRLFFDEFGNDNQGMILDNISLTATPVPLPAGIVLGLTGLAALAGFRRRA